MEPTEATPRPRTERQDEILDRALELARQGGLGSLTMRRIAERIGFSDAALYRHFPTKQALLLALAERLESLFLGQVRRIVADPTLDARRRLEAMLTHHVRMIIETDGLPLLIVAEAAASGDEVVAGRMAGVMRAYLEILRGVLRELPRAGRSEARSEVPAESGAGEVPAEQQALLLVGLPAALAIQRRLLREGGLDVAAAQHLARTLIARLFGTAGSAED